MEQDPFIMPNIPQINYPEPFLYFELDASFSNLSSIEFTPEQPDSQHEWNTGNQSINNNTNACDHNIFNEVLDPISPREPLPSGFRPYQDSSQIFGFINDYTVMNNIEQRFPRLQDYQQYSIEQEQVESSISSAEYSLQGDMERDCSLAEKPRIQPHHLHHGQGIYVCSFCSEGFGKKNALNRHKRKHVRPVKCPASGCDHRTATNRDLRRHLDARHVGEESVRHLLSFQRYLCPETGCRYPKVGFKRKDHLKRHLKTVHHRSNP